MSVAGCAVIWLNATRYMCMGSWAWLCGSPWENASTARKEPASALSPPTIIQPGPPASIASHQRRRCLRAGPGSGMKRRKSTCSPICATRENITVAAAPNSTRLKAPSPPMAPSKPCQRLSDSGS